MTNEAASLFSSNISSFFSAIVGGLVTAIGSYFIFVRQIKVKIREDIKSRKLAAYNKAIECVAELLGIIRIFSSENKAFMEATKQTDGIEALLNNPTYANHLKTTDLMAYQQLQALFDRYHRIMVETWKVNGLFRLNLDTNHSDKFEELVNYLNSFYKRDLSDPNNWQEMRKKCYEVVDVCAEEIRKLEK